MIQRIDNIKENVDLDDYAGFAHLAGSVQELRSTARTMLDELKGRTIWMVNSTAQGGGVAEMLPKVVDIMRKLGAKVEWLVMTADEPEFFRLTKRIHNMIHDFGQPGFASGDKTLYERVSKKIAEQLKARIDPADILVVHDPQPLAAGAAMKRQTGVRTIWRCHIGLDQTTATTRSVWDFLKPYAEQYDHAVFSAPEYFPPYLAGKSSIIHPALDPLSHKNRDLSPHKLLGILCNAGLLAHEHPVLTPAWEKQALRLSPGGRMVRVNSKQGIGLLYRPTVTQISRWDRLKGWQPLLEGFLCLKRRYVGRKNGPSLHIRRIDILKLVLAGPDPAGISDDPEGKEVFAELAARYRELSPAEQESVAIVTLPMDSLKQNALMVNALQRCSTVVVQNSLREGFGLTATEAMWKRVPVLGTTACGLRQQIRDQIDGRLVHNPQDPEEIADKLDLMLKDAKDRELWGRNGQRHVHDKFLIFTQVQNWLNRLAMIAAKS